MENQLKSKQCDLFMCAVIGMACAIPVYLFRTVGTLATRAYPVATRKLGRLSENYLVALVWTGALSLQVISGSLVWLASFARERFIDILALLTWERDDDEDYLERRESA